MYDLSVCVRFRSFEERKHCNGEGGREEKDESNAIFAQIGPIALSSYTIAYEGSILSIAWTQSYKQSVSSDIYYFQLLLACAYVVSQLVSNSQSALPPTPFFWLGQCTFEQAPIRELHPPELLRFAGL